MALTRQVGQRVMASGGKFNGPGRITKVLPKNIDVLMEDGRKVRFAPVWLSDLAEGAEAPKPPSIWETHATVPTQHPGSIVTVEGKTGYFVVLADKFDKINVAVIGGDQGRYWRMPRKTITPVPLERFALTHNLTSV